MIIVVDISRAFGVVFFSFFKTGFHETFRTHARPPVCVFGNESSGVFRKRRRSTLGGVQMYRVALRGASVLKTLRNTEIIYEFNTKFEKKIKSRVSNIVFRFLFPTFTRATYYYVWPYSTCTNVKGCVQNGDGRYTFRTNRGLRF